MLVYLIITHKINRVLYISFSKTEDYEGGAILYAGSYYTQVNMVINTQTQVAIPSHY